MRENPSSGFDLFIFFIVDFCSSFPPCSTIPSLISLVGRLSFFKYLRFDDALLTFLEALFFLPLFDFLGSDELVLLKTSTNITKKKTSTSITKKAGSTIMPNRISKFEHNPSTKSH